MAAALDWRASGPPARRCAATSWRASWASSRAPSWAALLAELEEAAFTGEAVTREQALEVARRLRHNPPR